MSGLVACVTPPWGQPQAIRTAELDAQLPLTNRSALKRFLQKDPRNGRLMHRYSIAQLESVEQVAWQHGLGLPKYPGYQLLLRKPNLPPKHESILMADLVLSVARELNRGSLQPQLVDPDWQAIPSPAIADAVLKELTPGPYFAAKLNLFAPQNPAYQRLKAKLVQLREGSPVHRQTDLSGLEARILVNMERWRWLESRLGRSYVIANLANARLSVVSAREIVFDSKILIGKLYRQTPVFSSTIDSIIWHPNWTVPTTIWQEDLLPKLLLEPERLKELGMRLFRRQGGGLRQVDWDTFLAEKRLDLKAMVLIQEYGPQNPLGEVKVNFPNPYQIFLHDTPRRDLFAASRPTLSSGCIRVDQAVKLAELLSRLGGGEVPALEPDVRHKKVVLRYPIPIHIVYFTLWVDENGRLHEAPDVYQRDQLMASLLQNMMRPPRPRVR
jgi:murein L,D-transpeptidase YcbB/YkuD